MTSSALPPQAVVIDSLDKLLPGESPRTATRLSGPRLIVPGERAAIQIAFQAGSFSGYDRTECSVHVNSEIGDARVYLVKLVPCELPSYPDSDDGYLTTTPGLIPDVLIPLDGSGEVDTVRFLPQHWQSTWVEIDVPMDMARGVYTVTVEFRNEVGRVHVATTIELEIVGSAVIDPNAAAFAHSQWLHVDSLAITYGLEMWSDAHWDAIEQYVRTMVNHSIDTLFTPLFTPSIDVRPGGRRMTAQLIGVEKADDSYQFDFSRLHRWIDLAERVGIRRLEFAPLFTQWGAGYAPPIVVDGEVTKNDSAPLFGWHTAATSSAYRQFLSAFLPQLIDMLEVRGWSEYCFFHVSDEPDATNLESYRKAREIVAHHVGSIPIRDATSEVQFYTEGLLTHPIAGIDTAEEFIAAGATDVWAYTSVAHRLEYTNTYIALEATRTRIIGVQLFRAGVTGYLRWGFNFWLTQYSLRSIDPYRVTDGGAAFPSGDPFLVYPGADRSPVASLRLKYLAQGADDYRLLTVLANLIGTDAVNTLIDETAGMRVSLGNYPNEPAFFYRLRAAVLQHSIFDSASVTSRKG